MAQDVRQYGSNESLRNTNASLPHAISEFDKVRAASYRVYEDLYLNNSTDYKVVLRGEDDDDTKPIYVPNGEKIVEAKIRFLGQGLNHTFSKTDAGFDDKLKKLLARENWDQKWANLKRWGEIRGDAVLMVIGDDAKEDGRKLSIIEVDPSSYFPVESLKNPGKILGVYIVDEYPKPNGKENEYCSRVQKYMFSDIDEETDEVAPGSGVTYHEYLQETGTWDDRPGTTLKEADIAKGFLGDLTPEEDLPTEITTLPTFHFRAHPLMNAMFGRSGLAGLETLIGSVNQTMTDEELIMIFGGLGFYATDAGPARNAQGDEIPTTISPLAILDTPKDAKIYRVNGVASLEPSQTHMQHAENEMQQTKGVPDIAVGVVDATVAESGIALELKLGAILSAAQEQELEFKSVLKQFFYNLATQWFKAYEQVGFDDADGKLEIEIEFKDPKPVNQEKRFNQLMLMWDAGIISAKKLTEELTKIMGFEITEADFKQAIEDKKSMAIAADPFGAQLQAEQNQGDGTTGDPTGVGAGALNGQGG